MFPGNQPRRWAKARSDHRTNADLQREATLAVGAHDAAACARVAAGACAAADVGTRQQQRTSRTPIQMKSKEYMPKAATGQMGGSNRMNVTAVATAEAMATRSDRSRSTKAGTGSCVESIAQ